MVNKNVLSGLLLFSISILIGPYLMGPFKDDVLIPAYMDQFKEVQDLQGALATFDGAGGEDAKPAATEALAVAAGKTVIATLKAKQVEDRWDNFKFSHAHGNLEGILNILIGLVLAQLAIAIKFREVISWLFVAGSWGHAGFFIAGNFLLPDYQKLGFFFLVNGKYGGALLILGLVLTLAAVIMHLRAKKPA